MTNKKRALVGFGTLLLLGGFGAGILVARATPGGATRNKLSFAGNVQPVPAAGATVSFTFSNTDDTTTCTASAGSPSFDTSGNFVAEVDLSACPANFAFNGGSVTYSVAVNGTTIGTAQPVNPVPYAKYADKVAYDVNVTVTTGTFGPWTTTDGTGATVTGYAAARAACQKTVGTKTAHWCSNDEVARYASKGGTAGLAVNGRMWTSNAGSFGGNGGGGPLTDCLTFIGTTSTQGSTWYLPAADGGMPALAPGYIACLGAGSASLPLACCD